MRKPLETVLILSACCLLVPPASAQILPPEPVDPISPVDPIGPVEPVEPVDPILEPTPVIPPVGGTIGPPINPVQPPLVGGFAPTVPTTTQPAPLCGPGAAPALVLCIGGFFVSRSRCRLVRS